MVHSGILLAVPTKTTSHLNSLFACRCRARLKTLLQEGWPCTAIGNRRSASPTEHPLSRIRPSPAWPMTCTSRHARPSYETLPGQHQKYIVFVERYSHTGPVHSLHRRYQISSSTDRAPPSLCSGHRRKEQKIVPHKLGHLRCGQRRFLSSEAQTSSSHRAPHESKQGFACHFPLPFFRLRKTSTPGTRV